MDLIQTITAATVTSVVSMLGIWKLWLESHVKESVKDQFAAKWQERQLAYDKEIAGWKAGYEKALDENRIGFTRFHEEQAILLKNLYARLMKLYKLAYNISDGDRERQHQNFIDFEREFNDTKELYYTNEILVPESLGIEVLNVLNDQYMLQVHRRLASDNTDFDRASKSLDKVDELQKRIENLIPIVRRQFSCLLRGESISP